ncbi:GNAT family N-acetyltransferase [Oleisolibacter albus]|uniref:GNAT family N-acetyltransferase n=1 Tax=Oleisolibacter albus TaxID=2171757 RepID=UPI000DF30454|nr:GNAT family N-acetyltransferase [Oleisolibacter albus]
MRLHTPLATPRLLLRTLTAADVGPRYLGWLRDAEVTRFLEVRHGDRSAAATLAFVEEANASPDTLLLGMVLREGGLHVGNIKLGPIDPYHRRADLGLMLGERACWGQGLAAEAIAALTGYAFEMLGLNKVTASCYGNNEGSRRAFLKAGFHEAARRPRHWLCEGDWQDDILLEILTPV